jgi:hypothetical protein
VHQDGPGGGLTPSTHCSPVLRAPGVCRDLSEGLLDPNVQLPEDVSARGWGQSWWDKQHHLWR